MPRSGARAPKKIASHFFIEFGFAWNSIGPGSGSSCRSLRTDVIDGGESMPASWTSTDSDGGMMQPVAQTMENNSTPTRAR